MPTHSIVWSQQDSVCVPLLFQGCVWRAARKKCLQPVKKEWNSCKKYGGHRIHYMHSKFKQAAPKTLKGICVVPSQINICLEKLEGIEGSITKCIFTYVYVWHSTACCLGKESERRLSSARPDLRIFSTIARFLTLNLFYDSILISHGYKSLDFRMLRKDQ